MFRHGIKIAGMMAAIVLAIFFITRCGGNGGDSGPVVQPITYTGVTEPVAITLSNAPTLLANVLFDTTTSAEIPSAVSLTENLQIAGTLSDFEEHLIAFHRFTLNTIVGNAADGYRIPVAELINETVNCETGYYTAQGTLDDSTGTGTITANYYDCLLDGVTANGSLLLHFNEIRIDELTGEYQIVLTYEYLLMTYTEQNSSISVSGMLTIDESLSGNTFSLQMTRNYVKQDNNNSKMYRYENFVETAIVVSDGVTVTATSAITGIPTAIMYDSLYGSLVVDTIDPYSYSSPIVFYPDGGGPMLFSGASTRMQLSPESARHAKLELDLDGNTGFEVVRYGLWTELENYTTLDLTDSDGDGMHDSWERSYGLDVNVDDAASDLDGDQLTNLQEYQQGYDPNDPLSPAP